MKKILAVLLCVIMGVSLCQAAFAADSRDVRFETELASKLKALDLFLGVGENEDGTANFDLNRAPTRAEALTMLVRALGKGAETEAYPKTHPFTDVPAWADGVVSYAYDNGLTKGVSDTRFGAESAVSPAMYLTFMLRALGYSDDTAATDGDFAWAAPMALAAWCGILPTQADRADFRRADVVDVTCAALYACVKGTETPLHQKLVSEGAFTEAQFGAAFTEDPFADFRRIDAKVAEAIEAHGDLWQTGDRVSADKNTHLTAFHLILDMEEDNGTLTVFAVAHNGSFTLGKDNAVEGYGGGSIPCLIELDAETLEIRDCRTSAELVEEGLTLEEILSERALADWDAFTAGITRIDLLEAQRLLAGGEIEYIQPTYEEALAKLTENNDFSVERTIEAESCTVWLGSNMTPHGRVSHLYLIYKPGSAVGEGEVIKLPIPRENSYGVTSPPDELWLSEDGLTLYYTYHYDEALIYDDLDGTEEEKIMHLAGTYGYTVDLTTGEATLDIIPD